MDLIIGVTNCDYNNSNVKNWLNTINKNTKAQPLLINSSNNTTNIHLLVYRFYLIYDFLYKNNNIENVIVSDVFDVIFQSDPFIWMKNNIHDKKIIVGSEGIQYKNERWGKNNLILSMGEECYNDMKDNTIYCAGIIAGKRQEVADLCYSIYNMCESKNLIHMIPGGGAADQAIMNFILSKSTFHDITKFSSLEENFVCHCGTSLAIPEYDNLLIEKKPKIMNNKVYTHDDKLYSIVHQYNRIRENIEC